MKVHRINKEDFLTNTLCGLDSNNLKIKLNWSKVTCKNCLRGKNEQSRKKDVSKGE